MDQKIKYNLHNKCLDIISNRLEEYKKRTDDFQQAANQETKSSAGDKYETGRAMMQLEKDKVAAQLSEVLKLKKVFDQIDISKKYSKGELGALVITSDGNYYISASLGKVDLDTETYFCLSPVAPFGQELLSKEEGDEVKFNGKNSVIKAIH